MAREFDRERERDSFSRQKQSLEWSPSSSPPSRKVIRSFFLLSWVWKLIGSVQRRKRERESHHQQQQSKFVSSWTMSRLFNNTQKRNEFGIEKEDYHDSLAPTTPPPPTSYPKKERKRACVCVREREREDFLGRKQADIPIWPIETYWTWWTVIGRRQSPASQWRATWSVLPARR